MVLQCIALFASILFAGAAIYVSVVEQPARLKLADGPMLQQWKDSYDRASVMQAALAMVAALLGLWIGWRDGSAAWTIGGVLMLASWPWTFAVMMPGNRKLKATSPDNATAETRALIAQWGRFHLMRVALGTAGSLVYLSQFCR